MSAPKISELQDFAGKELLLAAQYRGLEIFKGARAVDATTTTIIGLADILAKHGCENLAELAKNLPKPPPYVSPAKPKRKSFLWPIWL